jgi:anaerobic magnesium-protoporphyrin IX monomethyl ester cyclase
MKPEGITREQVLKGVLKNYARFYMRKSFLEYPWIKDKFKRRYMLGCLKAFAKTTVTKKFYDLERVKYKGGLSTEIDLGFDESKILTPEQIAELKASRPDLAADVDFKGTTAPVLACGGPSDDQLREQTAALTKDKRDQTAPSAHQTAEAVG